MYFTHRFNVQTNYLLHAMCKIELVQQHIGIMSPKYFHQVWIYTLLIQSNKSYWIEKIFHIRCPSCIFWFDHQRPAMYFTNIFVCQVDKAHRCNAIFDIHGNSCQPVQQLDIDVSTWCNASVGLFHLRSWGGRNGKKVYRGPSIK